MDPALQDFLLEGASTLLEMIPEAGPWLSKGFSLLTSLFGLSGEKSVNIENIENNTYYMMDTTRLEANQQQILAGISQIQTMIWHMQEVIVAKIEESTYQIRQDMLEDTKLIMKAIQLSEAKISHVVLEVGGELATAVSEALERARQEQRTAPRLDDILSTLDNGIGFFTTYKTILHDITANSGYEVIRDFVNVSDSLTPMEQNRFSLEIKWHQLRGLLNRMTQDKNYAFTAILVNLYLLTTTWLLIYDKAVLHLRSYLAVSYLASNDIGNYLLSITKWNREFTVARSHILQAIEFFLGSGAGVSRTLDPKLLGLLIKLRNARAAALPNEWINNGYSFKTSLIDEWPPTAFGYAGPGDGDDRIPVDLPTLRVESQYRVVNFAFFDASAQSILDIVDRWQDCLIRWNSRVPISPPKRDRDNKPIEHVVAKSVETPGLGTPPDAKGYQQGTTVLYAISYVTSAGEGVPSDWSSPVNLDDSHKTCVKLTIREVTILEDPFKGYNRIEEHSQGTVGKGIDVIRRVYVKYTEPGQSTKHACLVDIEKEGEIELDDIGPQSG